MLRCLMKHTELKVGQVVMRASNYAGRSKLLKTQVTKVSPKSFQTGGYERTTQYTGAVIYVFNQSAIDRLQELGREMDEVRKKMRDVFVGLDRVTVSPK